MSKNNCATAVRRPVCTSACPAFATCETRLHREAVEDALLEATGNRVSAFDWRIQPPLGATAH